ncbi:MAG: hypothetical protein NW226_03075 [Microscillaceae bacterium]|nr:hypothetical protein [Microscillaceae bacterium]
MDLTKAAELVLSSKKAIFYPDSGSPLSGRYCWRAEDQIIYLHYEGMEDHLLALQVKPRKEFRRPPFESLMQKHIISCKKLPDMLLERTQKLLRDLAQNFELLKEKNTIISISRLDFLVFQQPLGYTRLFYDAGWRLSIDTDSIKLYFVQKLWKYPGIHTQNTSMEISYLLFERIDKVRKQLAMIHQDNYVLCCDQEVFFYLDNRYLKISRNHWEALEKEELNQKISVETVSKELFLEKLLFEQNKKSSHINTLEGLKKAPEDYQKLFAKIINLGQV